MDKSEAQVGAKIISAIYDSIEDTLTVTTAVPIEGDLKNAFTLEGPDGQMKIKGVSVEDGTNEYVLEYEGKINSEDVFTVYHKGTPCVVTVPNTYSTEYFENLYTYGGDDLGATWTTKENGTIPYSKMMTIQPNDTKVNGEAGTFAFFNDTIRNAIHGGVFVATDKGFVSGNMTPASKRAVTSGYIATSGWGSNGGTVDTPLQTVNYASCHDNYTLFDNLTVDVMDATGCTAAEAALQAAAMNNLAAADAQLTPLATEEAAEEITEEEARSMLDSIKAFFENLFG